VRNVFLPSTRNVPHSGTYLPGTSS
jgi:hypothetical protein